MFIQVHSNSVPSQNVGHAIVVHPTLASWTGQLHLAVGVVGQPIIMQGVT